MIRNNRSETRQLAVLALLVSLNIILSRVGSIRVPLGGVEGFRIGFGAFPLVFAGLVYGPAGGAIVGTAGDLLGYFINPMGGYLPIFTLTAALRGFLPGLIWKMTGRPLTWTGVFLPLLASGLCSALSVPFLLNAMFKVPLTVTLPGHLLSMCITVPLYTFIFLKLYRGLHRRGIF
ncbi:MAG: folate family ECF transporter S component [Pyramidobacter sp.]|nr:folate family ECF transporter S component [Pyramidobacter sp.]